MTAAGWETAASAAGAVALVVLVVSYLFGWFGGGTPPAWPVGAAARRRAAAQLANQDDLVQTLVVATYALQLGDHDRARVAVDSALRQSRHTLDRMLAEAGRGALSRRDTPGAPRRTARVTGRIARKPANARRRHRGGTIGASHDPGGLTLAQYAVPEAFRPRARHRRSGYVRTGSTAGELPPP